MRAPCDLASCPPPPADPPPLFLPRADYDIILWPTSLTASKPLGVLHGHTSPVTRVLAVEGGLQLVSVGTDGSIRLWDVAMGRCVQVLNDPARKQPADVKGAVEVSSLDVSAATIDGRSGGLLTASTAPAFWRARKTNRAEQRTHDYAPSLAVYNSVFGVIVSADESSSLAVWKVETGQCLGRFDRAHGVSKITSLAFDSTGRRLLSGAHDGSVRVWNFSSGECLRACVSPPSDAVEVTGVLHVPPTKSRPGLFVSVGWSKALTCFPDQVVRSKVRARLWCWQPACDHAPFASMRARMGAAALPQMCPRSSSLHASRNVFPPTRHRNTVSPPPAAAIHIASRPHPSWSTSTRTRASQLRR